MAGEAGFTLIEVIVVLVILGLLAGLVVARGPARSPALDGRAAASLVEGTLRGARAAAIKGNAPVTVVFDTTANRFGIAGGRMLALPRDVAMSLVVSAPLAAGGRAGIGFAPDGSSSGGEVRLGLRGRRFVVGVNWLTGRVGTVESSLGGATP